MPRRIVILPASTKAGRETIRVLLQSESKPFVRAVYRNPAKAPAEFLQNPNFEAVQGDVSSGSGLDFAGFNTLFYIPPPTYEPGADQSEFATRAATNIKDAINKAGTVSRLLIFSAVGSQYDRDIVCIPHPCSLPTHLPSYMQSRFYEDSHLTCRNL